jgi:hypothetical protein
MWAIRQIIQERNVRNWSPLSELSIRFSRGTVVGTDRDGGLVVLCDGDQARNVLCDMVQATYLPVQLESGDAVLVLLPEAEEGRGVILGRIVPAQASAPAESAAEAGTQDEIVIEAKKNLTLKCGEGSITIREDGKILIKGKDLVSHAQRMNRIKGGSVSIN